MTERIDGTQYTGSVHIAENELRSILPVDLVSQLGVATGEVVRYTPTLRNGSLALDLRFGVSDTGHRNQRALMLKTDFGGGYLRYPLKLIQSLGLPSHVDDYTNCRVEYHVDVDDPEHVTVGFLPRLKPWYSPGITTPVDELKVVNRTWSHPEGGAGSELSEQRRDRLAFPVDYATHYGFEEGMEVGIRAAAAEGELVLALDVSGTSAHDLSVPLQTYYPNSSQSDRAGYPQFAVDIPMSVAHGFGLSRGAVKLHPRKGTIWLSKA